jgi:F-type H+-transporting ATPase subunit epsilon
LHCRLVVPEGVLFDGDASLIVARSPNGEFAVMDNHAPLLAVLDPSPLRIKTSAEEHVYALSGGLLRVEQTGVTIAAEQAISVDEIDLAEVKGRRTEMDEQLKATPDDEKLLRELEILSVQERIKERHG